MVLDWIVCAELVYFVVFYAVRKIWNYEEKLTKTQVIHLKFASSTLAFCVNMAQI